MKFKHILLFFISIVCAFQVLNAQQTAQDTIKKSPYGLRVGFDLSKPVRTLLDNEYAGFEIVADFRITKKIFIAGELGNESKDYFENNLNATSRGSYIKLGIDYNSYVNWGDANNMIYGGLRIGVASFTQELLAYRVFINDQTFPANTVIANTTFSGLTASWAELQIGIRTEVLKNLYLGIHAQIKYLVTQEVPPNFGNIFIPGFNQQNDFSRFGVGYGYSVSYLIPIFKK